jgi:hypothetical protein
MVQFWKGEKPKLRSNNHFMVNGVTFFYCKKDWEGKPSSFYNAYRYKDGMFIHGRKNKETMMEEVAERYEQKIKEYEDGKSRILR